MKIAIVTDSLLQFGGTERVLQALLKIYPDVDVYTSFIDREVLNNFFPFLTKNRIHVLPLQSFKRLFINHSSFLQLLAPILWKSFNFEKYDLVISNSSGLMCNLIKIKKSIHIQYINSIPLNIFGFSPMKRLQKILHYTTLLTHFYSKAIKSSQHIIANSKYTQRILFDLFRISSKVIYPPVRIPKTLPKRNIPQYFIIISRLDREKNIEIAIQACNLLKLPLKIIGRSNDQKYKQYLKSISGLTIDFIDIKTDLEENELNNLYKNAMAFIFTSKIDAFGITPVEAMAHGIPVIAYYGGGAMETIINKKTGIFFYKNDVESLINTLNNFSKITFDSFYIHNHAKLYNEETFINEIFNYISLLETKK